MDNNWDWNEGTYAYGCLVPTSRFQRSWSCPKSSHWLSLRILLESIPNWTWLEHLNYSEPDGTAFDRKWPKNLKASHCSIIQALRQVPWPDLTTISHIMLCNKQKPLPIVGSLNHCICLVLQMSWNLLNLVFVLVDMPCRVQDCDSGFMFILLRKRALEGKPLHSNRPSGYCISKSMYIDQSWSGIDLFYSRNSHCSIHNDPNFKDIFSKGGHTSQRSSHRIKPSCLCLVPSYHPFVEQ